MCSPKAARWPKGRQPRSAPMSTSPRRTSAGRASPGKSPMSEPVLEVRGLRVAYGPVDVLHGLDLVVGRGEAVALVGPNGAGKSTTLATITRHVPAKAGDILLAGRSLLRHRPEDVARAGIALVPEGRHLFTGMSVAENLQLGLTARRDPDGLDADRAWVEE